MFLDCAQAAKADYLVTGNTAHFPKGRWKYAQVVTPRQFIEMWGEADINRAR
jgi:predicted nucleic acid-binding protein